MITEKELDEAIRQYEDTDNPTSQTCIALAAFYAVKDHLYPAGISYDAPFYSGDTEFGRVVQNRKVEDVMAIMEELMTALQVLHPNLYESVLTKLGDT